MFFGKPSHSWNLELSGEDPFAWWAFVHETWPVPDSAACQIYLQHSRYICSMPDTSAVPGRVSEGHLYSLMSLSHPLHHLLKPLHLPFETMSSLSCLSLVNYRNTRASADPAPGTTQVCWGLRIGVSLPRLAPFYVLHEVNQHRSPEFRDVLGAAALTLS